MLIAISFHETAHGYAAYKHGDPTARNLGRLSLNPLKHIDPIGALCMLFFRFGWAKPVPINSRYFKKPRRDIAIVSLAGPAMNVLLAFIGVLLYQICNRVFGMLLANAAYTSFGYTAAGVTLMFLENFYLINVSFAVFNLLPIPPLDGSRLLMIILPSKVYYAILKYERPMMIVLLILLYFGVLSVPLSYLASGLLRALQWIVGLIPFL